MNHAVSNPQAPLLYQMGPQVREGMNYSSQDPQPVPPPPKFNKWTYESVTQAIRGASSAASLSMSFKDMIEKKVKDIRRL